MKYIFVDASGLIIKTIEWHGESAPQPAPPGDTRNSTYTCTPIASEAGSWGDFYIDGVVVPAPVAEQLA